MNKDTIIITGVVETSAADEAGILPGDIVISVDNRSTKHPDDLIGVLSIKKPNDILVFEIYRKGKKITKSIKLKKYLIWSADPQVNLPVCVIVPVKFVVLSMLFATALCLACTFNLLFVIVVIFPASAVYAAMLSPPLGDVIAVIVEF